MAKVKPVVFWFIVDDETGRLLPYTGARTRKDAWAHFSFNMYGTPDAIDKDHYLRDLYRAEKWTCTPGDLTRKSR